MFSSRRRRVSRQASPFSPSLTRACVRDEFAVEFTQDYLFPSPRARDTVSFEIDDVLLTAASDSEDFGPSLADALPLSFRTPLGSSRWIGPDEPRESRSSKLDERFLSGVNSKMSGGSCRFSVICIRRSPDPGNSLFLPALLTWRPLTSPTSWVRWSRAIPPCPLWHLCGSPAPSFRLNRVGLLPLWSVSPTSWPVRQVWPFHTMAILQAYQADVLKEMDEGTGLTPEEKGAFWRKWRPGYAPSPNYGLGSPWLILPPPASMQTGWHEAAL